MRKLGFPLLVLSMLLIPGSVFASTSEDHSQLERAVRKQILTLPYYGVFDDISYEVAGNTVILHGAVHQPTLRSSAERVVSRLEGVHSVVNRIEVLPLSPFDNRIRVAVAQSVYGYSALNRYAAGAHPSIHVIVKNGNVTLTGVVANDMDSQLAYMRARQVGGAFSVTNDLRVENPRR